MFYVLNALKEQTNLLSANITFIMWVVCEVDGEYLVSTLQGFLSKMAQVHKLDWRFCLGPVSYVCVTLKCSPPLS